MTRLSIDEFQILVDLVINSDFVRKNFPLCPGWIEVAPGRKDSQWAWAQWLTKTIKVGGEALYASIAFHEIVHFLVPRNLPDHGSDFAGTHIAIVEFFQGPKNANLLRECYEFHKVKFKNVKVATLPLASQTTIRRDVGYWLRHGFSSVDHFHVAGSPQTLCGQTSYNSKFATGTRLVEANWEGACGQCTIILTGEPEYDRFIS